MRGRTLVVIVSLLALWVSTAHAAPTHVTVSLQPSLSADNGQAQVDLAVQSGFNSIRLIAPWTYPWQAEVKNDAPRFCNVAAPAAGNHLSLFFDLIPNTPPVTASQISQRYDKTINDYLNYFVGANGCAKGLAEVDVQVANEPNYSVFYKNQDTAAADYTHLAVRTCLFLDLQSTRNSFTAPINCVVGELAASHDPVGFINGMKAEAVKMGVVGPFFDAFSYHCYGTGSSAYTSPDAIRAALKADFGYSGPVLCTEYALPHPTSQQYCQVGAMAQNTGLAALGWFRLMDDATGSPTGLYYFNSALGQLINGSAVQAVAKVPNVAAINAALMGGTLAC